MKHYISVEFLSLFRMSSPPAETQSPSIENFLATVLTPGKVGESSPVDYTHGKEVQRLTRTGGSVIISLIWLGPRLNMESAELSEGTETVRYFIS